MKIPHFKEILVSAFECKSCQFTNNEIQSSLSIEKNGLRIKCLVMNEKDLNRKIVRSENASIYFPELELDLPHCKKACLTTIEGLLFYIIDDLKLDQESRKNTDFHVYEKIQLILERIQNYINGREKFTLLIDDPSGCSFIEFSPDENANNIKTEYYERSKEQQESLGFSTQDPDSLDVLDEDVYNFSGFCSSCGANCDTRMQTISIPFFSDLLIMSTLCDKCGYKSNEIKCGGPIPDKGKVITFTIKNIEDLNRDVLKSDSCTFKIPEIDFTLSTGTLGSRFTTVEGLIDQIMCELKEKCGFLLGDSASYSEKNNFLKLISNLEKVF